MSVKPQTETPDQKVIRQANLDQVISQIDMLLGLFAQGGAPERVTKSATEFRDAVKEWRDA